MKFEVIDEADNIGDEWFDAGFKPLTKVFVRTIDMPYESWDEMALSGYLSTHGWHMTEEEKNELEYQWRKAKGQYIPNN